MSPLGFIGLKGAVTFGGIGSSPSCRPRPKDVVGDSNVFVVAPVEDDGLNVEKRFGIGTASID